MKKQDKFEDKKHDVIIVGAGSAGLRAAVEAAKNGAKVAVITKTTPFSSLSVAAQGGIAGAVGEKDSWQKHFKDSYRSGQGLCDPIFVEILAKEAPKRSRELEGWGVEFENKDDGTLNVRFLQGHSDARVLYAKKRVGTEIVKTLYKECQRLGVIFFTNTHVFDLVKRDGKVCGVVSKDQKSQKISVIPAKSVILATGNDTNLWKRNTNPTGGIGGGIAIGFRAGVEMEDVEMVQYHPTAIIRDSGKGILPSPSITTDKGVPLHNSNGDRFLFKYIPYEYKDEFATTSKEADAFIEGELTARKAPELLPHDIVCRAISNEVKEGRGSPNGGAYFDLKSKLTPDEIKEALPSIYKKFLRDQGVDITKVPIEVVPAAHFFLGGIKVDPETCRSNVKGLYAAGECAAGLHGASRIGGNSLAEAQVFGKRAGEAAANYAKQVEFLRLDVKVRKDVSMKGELEGEDPAELLDKLKEIMQTNVGLVKNRDGLEEALELIEALKQVSVRSDEFDRDIDFKNALLSAECITKSALAREESNEVFHTISKLNDNGVIEVKREAVESMPEHLKIIIEDK